MSERVLETDRFTRQEQEHQDNLEYGWRHAFAYADQFVSTGHAVAYATHYIDLVKDEEDMNYWPSHGLTFADWKTKAAG